MNTLFRIINAVFSGEEFQSSHEKVATEDVFERLKEIPYQLSIEQKRAVVNALNNDVVLELGCDNCNDGLTLDGKVKGGIPSASTIANYKKNRFQRKTRCHYNLF